jgi:hypothetical protein
MIIPTEDIIQQQNFEQLCENIKHLDIQQKTKVNNIVNQQNYPTTQLLPSINELIDYQSLIIRLGELERRINLHSHEIENLRKEYSELNEKISSLIQIEVNVQLESKFNYLKQEFDNYKEELNERYNNDRKFMNNNNNNNNNVYDTFNTFNNFEPNSQTMNYNFNHPQRNDNNFGIIRNELQTIANELNNDRDSFTERVNSIRNMYNNQYNF